MAVLVTHLAGSTTAGESYPICAMTLFFHEISTMLCHSTEPGRHNAVEKLLRVIIG